MMERWDGLAQPSATDQAVDLLLTRPPATDRAVDPLLTKPPATDQAAGSLPVSRLASAARQPERRRSATRTLPPSWAWPSSPARKVRRKRSHRPPRRALTPRARARDRRRTPQQPPASAYEPTTQDQKAVVPPFGSNPRQRQPASARSDPTCQRRSVHTTLVRREAPAPGRLALGRAALHCLHAAHQPSSPRSQATSSHQRASSRSAQPRSHPPLGEVRQAPTQGRPPIERVPASRRAARLRPRGAARPEQQLPFGQRPAPRIESRPTPRTQPPDRAGDPSAMAATTARCRPQWARHSQAAARSSRALPPPPGSSSATTGAAIAPRRPQRARPPSPGPSSAMTHAAIAPRRPQRARRSRTAAHLSRARPPSPGPSSAMTHAAMAPRRPQRARRSQAAARSSRVRPPSPGPSSAMTHAAIAPR